MLEKCATTVTNQAGNGTRLVNNKPEVMVYKWWQLRRKMKTLRIIKQIAQSTYTQVKRRCTKRHTTAASMKMRLTKHMEPNLHKMEQVAKINLRLSLTQSKEMHPEMFETKHHPMEMTPVQIPNTDDQKKSTQRKNENTKRINKKIAGSRARIMLSRVLDEMGSRLYQEQPLQGKLPRLGGNILNRLQHQKTDLHNNNSNSSSNNGTIAKKLIMNIACSFPPEMTF